MSTLLDKSKSDTPDKFRKRSDVADGKWELWRVGVSELKITNDLYLYFKANGYTVGVKFKNYKQVLLKYLNGKFSGDTTKVIQKSLAYAIKNLHVETACDCPDFKYRYAYMSTKKKYGLNQSENRPSNKTNPDLIGGLCKHQIKVMNAPSKWLPYVIPAIRDFIKNNYSEDQD